MEHVEASSTNVGPENEDSKGFDGWNAWMTCWKQKAFTTGEVGRIVEPSYVC